jgi:predicted RNA-binding protein
MASNPHRSSVPRRVLLWVVGVVVTGRVVNSPSEYELRQMSSVQVAASVVAFGVSMALFVYVGVVMHSGVRAAILTYAGMTVAIASIPFVVQACVARSLRAVEGLSGGDSESGSVDPVGSDARTRL